MFSCRFWAEQPLVNIFTLWRALLSLQEKYAYVIQASYTTHHSPPPPSTHTHTNTHSLTQLPPPNTQTHTNTQYKCAPFTRTCVPVPSSSALHSSLEILDFKIPINSEEEAVSGMFSDISRVDRSNDSVIWEGVVYALCRMLCMSDRISFILGDGNIDIERKKQISGEKLENHWGKNCERETKNRRGNEVEKDGGKRRGRGSSEWGNVVW